MTNYPLTEKVIERTMEELRRFVCEELQPGMLLQVELPEDDEDE